MRGHRRAFGPLLALAGVLTSTALILPAPAPAAAGSEGVATLFKQAEFWKQKGRTDLAIAAVRRVLAISPDNAQAKTMLADLSKPPVLPPGSGTQTGDLPEVGGRRLGDIAAGIRGGGEGPTKPIPYVRNAHDQAGVYRLQGFSAIEQGKLAYAGERFRAALKYNANDPDALGGLGIVELRSGRFEAARALLLRAKAGRASSKWDSALQSATFYGKLRDAQALRDANRLAQAETATRALNPIDARESALARSLLGDIFARQGRYAEALAMYRSIPAGAGGAGIQSVLDIQTRQTRLAAMQAVSRGDYAGAEQVFQHALVGGGGDPWLRYDYARLLMAQNRLEQADGVMAPLSRSRTPQGLYAAALYASQVGRTAAANALMAQIPQQSLTPQMATFLVEQRVAGAVTQARALAAQGRTGEAIGYLRQIARQPLSVTAMGAIADELYTLGDMPTAIAIAQTAAAQPVSDPDAYQGVVVVLAKAGLDQVAVPLVQRLAQQSGQNPYNSRSMARLNALLASTQSDRLRVQGNFAPAFDILQAAWATAPGDIDLLCSLARLYQSGRLYAQAQTVYGLVLQQMPNNVGNLIGFSDSAIGAGDLPAARQSVAHALSVAPAEPGVYLVAARLETARGKSSAAMRYLMTARQLKTQQSNLYGPTISPTNPFGSYRQPQVQRPINPFALTPGNTVRQPMPRTPFSYAPSRGVVPGLPGATSSAREG